MKPRCGGYPDPRDSTAPLIPARWALTLTVDFQVITPSCISHSVFRARLAVMVVLAENINPQLTVSGLLHSTLVTIQIEAFFWSVLYHHLVKNGMT
jgi:hypothetical protein